MKKVCSLPKRNTTLVITTKTLLVMKLTAVLLIAACLQVSANGNAQTISISQRNTTLEKVFKEIHRKTGYQFFYQDELLQQAKKFDISVKNASIEQVLEICFKNQPLTFIITENAITIKRKEEVNVSNAPPSFIEIIGKVKDEKGNPLAGVSVSIVGEKGSVITDDRGNFSIAVPENAVLSFSYVGYKTVTVPVKGKASIEITLNPQESSLDDVVVIGYGTQKKVDLTGSVSSIKGTALTKAPSPNLATSLTGKMTGVITTQQSGKPGFDDPVFYIRGKSTFGNNSALVLVDGIERPFNRIDPGEIESVTVLKDAASASVYGARGANGVILITTKRGSEGPSKISYTSSIGHQTPTIVPHLMNAYEYAKYLNIARANIGAPPRFTDQEIQQYKEGTLPSADWWSATLKKRATINQHTLTVSGGNKISKYFVSLGYLDQDGLYDLSYFKRYNVRANFDTKISKSFRVSLDLAGRMEKISQSVSGDALFSTVISSYPTEKPYVPDSVEPGGLGSNGQSTSPLGQATRSGYNRTNNNVFQSTIQAVYDLPYVKGLSAKFSYSYDFSFSGNKAFSTPFTFYIYDKTNNIYNQAKSSTLVTLTQATANSNLQTIQASINYDRKFGEHSIAGIVLFEQSESFYENVGAYREGFLSTAIDQIFAGGDLNRSNGGFAFQTARRGYIGRVNYNYAGKYLFQANFRYDGSFNFPNDKRWGFFPAVSAGWRISEETFMKRIDFLNNLKVRVSYGQFGNDRVRAYQYLSGFQFGAGAQFGSGYNLGIVDLGIPNPDITWETATNTDVALEFGILNNKISGEFGYFHKRTKDILLPRNASIPLTFGATLPDENIGIVDNKGIETLLRYTDQFGKFNLSVEGNMTYVKSKVIFMDEPVNVEDRIKRTGRPFDQFYGLKAAGLFQSQSEINNWADQDGTGNTSIRPGDIKYLDYNKDNKIDGFDIQYIGKSDVPELIFGFNVSAGFKGFDLTANFQGATRFQQYLRYDPFNLDANALAIFTDSWTPDNPNAKYPTLYAGIKNNNRLTSSFWLYDGTYMRLRNLELSYTFSKLNAFQKAGINRLRIFVSGNNLLTFSKLKDFDPEVPNVEPGRIQYYYPQLKAFSMGLNLEF